jgi:hypothetical protein
MFNRTFRQESNLGAIEAGYLKLTILIIRYAANTSTSGERQADKSAGIQM